MAKWNDPLGSPGMRVRLYPYSNLAGPTGRSSLIPIPAAMLGFENVYWLVLVNTFPASQKMDVEKRSLSGCMYSMLEFQ